MIKNNCRIINNLRLLNRSLNKKSIYNLSYVCNLKINNQILNKKKLNLNICTLRLLSDNQYEKIAEDTLESLNDYFDELLENQTKIVNYDLSLSSGVLTIKLDQYGTYVINKQTPNKQIWLSSPISGPKRYDYIDGRWIYKHDNCSLHELLNHEISSILELNDIDFNNCEYGKR